MRRLPLKHGDSPGGLRVIGPGGELAISRPNEDRIRSIARVAVVGCTPTESTVSSTCDCSSSSTAPSRMLAPGTPLTRVCESWEYSSEPTDAAAVWTLARSWARSRRISQFPAPMAMGDLAELVTAESTRALSRALLVESFAGPSYLLHPRSDAVLTGEE